MRSIVRPTSNNRGRERDKKQKITDLRISDIFRPNAIKI